MNQTSVEIFARKVTLFPKSGNDPSRNGLGRHVLFIHSFFGFLIIMTTFFLCTETTIAEEYLNPTTIVSNAYKNPSPQSINLLLDYLHKNNLVTSEGYYILEGDLILTRKQVKEYLYQGHFSINAEKKVKSFEGNGELLVRAGPNGTLDYWEKIEDRHLTYAIDKRTFRSKTDYEIIVKGMHEAAASWNDACPECQIKFDHLDGKFDLNPSFENVKFIVRQQNNKWGFWAIAFFPSSAQTTRFLKLDRSFFNIKDKELQIGILKHELGHILGYGHEHMRNGGIEGCRKDANDGFHLLPVSEEYDATSVMHSFCGKESLEKRKEKLRLNLTPTDIQGHRKLYLNGVVLSRGPERKLLPKRVDWKPEPTQEGAFVRYAENVQETTKTPHKTDNTLIVDFEGWNYPHDSVKVFNALRKVKGVISSQTHDVTIGESLCGILKNENNFPGGCTSLLIEKIAEINNWVLPETQLWPGEEVKIPKLRFEEYRSKKYLNPSYQDDKLALDNYRKNFRPKPSIRAFGSQKHLAEVEHNAWVLKIPNLTYSQVNSALDAVINLDLPDVTVNIEKTIDKNIHYNVSPNNPSFNKLACKESGEIDYLTYFSSSSLNPSSDSPSCANSKGPEIIILDNQLHPHRDLLHAVNWNDVRQDLKFYNRVNDLKAFERDLSDIKVKAQRSMCKGKTNWEERFHSLHLSCIVGCEENSFEFSGICPGVSIRPIIYDEGVTNNSYILKRFRNEFSPDPEYPKVVLVAGELPYHDQMKHKDNKYILKHPKRRLDDNLIAKMIRDQKLLLVSAVGQPPNAKLPESEPLYFNSNSAKAPSNLGHFRFTLNVTTCNPCTLDRNGRLWNKAHYSTENGLVHVAAPGLNIQGIAYGDYLTVGDGTSQSAAFIAGLVAEMGVSFPGQYTEPGIVKRRVQVISYPVLDILEKRVPGREGEEPDNRITGGIVDPALALLNPKVGWLKETVNLVGNKNPQYKPVEIKGWCTKNFHLSPEWGNEPNYWRTEIENPSDGSIFRILQVPGDSPDKNKWVKYRQFLKNGDRSGENIEIIGPGEWSHNWTENKYLIRIEYLNDSNEPTEPSTVKDLRLYEIADLIFPNFPEIRGHVSECDVSF